MKRQTIIIILCWVALTVAAQTDIPLLSALQTIERSQSEYRIDIVSDGLDSLRTSTNVSGLDAVKSVKRVCKGLPVKVLFTEPQYSPTAAETIARETGARLYKLDPVVTGEATPEAKDAYLNTMRENMKVLKEALQ